MQNVVLTLRSATAQTELCKMLDIVIHRNFIVDSKDWSVEGLADKVNHTIALKCRLPVFCNWTFL